MGFWAVYGTHPKQWWAIIPGGVLLTLALVAGLDTISVDQSYSGGVFFLGLATTFCLVYLLPTPPNRMCWAMIPAVIFGVLGLFTLTASTEVLDYVWPVALIGAGMYMMYRTYRGRPAVSTTSEGQTVSHMEEQYDQPTLPQSR